ncbi:MAG: DUF4421 domain-containing protein [Spirochaetaceae bacterium]|nr:DUF4421 domain-containing protein [Spirochaetaceae bacterium]
MTQKRLFVLLALFSAITAGLFPQEPSDSLKQETGGAIESFDSKFSVGVNAKYNFLLFDDAEVNSQSNTPVFLGFSFGFRDYTLSFSIAQTYTYTPGPGTRPAFDAALGLYQKYWFEELSFKYYDDFKANDEPFAMRYLAGALSGAYVFNAGNFSLPAVFRLNRVQRESAGSFIAGGNLRFFSLQSDALEKFHDRAWYVCAGPNAGYSYTFVTSNAFFINLYALGGVNFGLEPTRHDFVLTAFVNPRITVGMHFKTWSFNFVTQIDCTAFIFGDGKYHTFFYGAAAPGASKRF